MDLRAAEDALRRRAAFLKRIGLEARDFGYDIVHSPPVFDGTDFIYTWSEVLPASPTPPGWFRYGKDYWVC